MALCKSVLPINELLRQEATAEVNQKPAEGRRFDVLMVDGDKSLVVAELKIVEDAL